jgi:outer membrane receptor protein involved in Fe transport
MTDRYRPILRALRKTAFIAALAIITCASARADVVGRLKFSVKNADNEKPVSGAQIVLKDSANTHADVLLTTDTTGTATSPPIDARQWTAITKADTFQNDTRQIAVVADTTTDVEVLLEPLKEKTITVRSSKDVIRKSDTSNATVRNQKFIETFPLNPQNPFSLNSLLETVPGFAADSANQAHPRGEHNSTTIFVNGFELPDALQGRAGQLLTPQNLQDVDIMTGAFAPEYGGETAAILNVNLRSGPINPLRAFEVEGGSFGTFDGALTFGGQGGAPIGLPDSAGRQARRFGYFVDLSARTTQLALEAPQPGDQTAHNLGESQSYFGNFDYQAGNRDHFTLTLNSTPAYTQIANRTGLPAQFASVGQGYGFGGELSAAQAASEGLGSQQAEGQDIYQRDVNDFGVLNYRHTFSDQLSGLFSVGLVHSGQSILNNNPGGISQTDLPPDNSIEYSPTIIRNYHHTQFEGSLTWSGTRHTVKGGGLYDIEEGDEYYQLTPQSQIALDALYADAPNLAPAGTPAVDGQGNPVMDADGFQVYNINKSNPGTPVVQVHRTGHYAAGYIQDTWKPTRRFTANYGLRLDNYQQSQNLGQPDVDTTDLSPRINLAYVMNSKTVGRISYNRLFIQPPLAQGAIIGEPITPERLKQYDVNIEHQLAPGQTVKVAYYLKEIWNQIDTGLLIPNTQIGAYTAVNFDRGHVHGFELSYNCVPRNGIGASSYLSWANALAQPTGLDNTGANAPLYNDHDQLNTITAGMAYTWKSLADVAASLYYGSGVASSIVFPTDSLGNGPRTPRSQVNLSFSTGPRFFGRDGASGGRGGLTLSIENIFNNTSVINFDSGFSGTRFQQARTVMLSASGNF